MQATYQIPAGAAWRRLWHSPIVWASDASTAIAGAARKTGVTAATGAKHLQHEYTPLRTLRKRHLPETVSRMLSSKSSASSSSTGQPTVKAKAHFFDFAQGDNTAESLVSGIKNELRRVQLKGRSGRARATVDSVLGSFVVLRQSGLHAVLKALEVYMKHGQRSGENPNLFFAEEAIDEWLKQAK